MSEKSLTAGTLDDPAVDPFERRPAAAAVIASAPASSATTSPSCSARLGPAGDAARRDDADDRQHRPARASPRPPSPGTSGTIRSVAIGDTGRRALVFGTRTHFYEGRGVRRVVHGVRTAAAAGCRDHRAHQRLRRARARRGRPARPVLISDHINLTGDSPARGREVRRPHRPLLAPAARAVPRGRRRRSTRASTCSSAARTTRRRPRCGWPGPSAATSSACRRRSRRSPPARPAWRSSASRWSPTSPPASRRPPLNHEEVLEAGRAAAEPLRRLLADVVAEI